MSDVSVSSQPAVGAPRIDDRDWSQLTLGQRIQQLEVEGYVVLPDLLDTDHISTSKHRLRSLKRLTWTTASINGDGQASSLPAVRSPS